MTSEAFTGDELGRVVETIARVMRSALAPWGGAAAYVDVYETVVRVATDAQLGVARIVDVEPLRSLCASCADMTRDIGATQLSSARWVLDV
jgi:hypothetical protein